MSTRDRSLIFVLVLVVIAVGGYFVVVQPKQHQSSQLRTEIASAQTQLSQAEAQVETGLHSESEYKTYRKQLSAIQKAVPEDEQIPELINELQASANKSHLKFVTVSTSSTSSSVTTAGTAGSATAGSSFPSQSFSLSFTGSYYGVANLLGRLASYVHTDNDKFKATGRLLSITAVSISRGGDDRSASSPAPGNAVTAAVTASDYDLPGALLASGSSTGTVSP